MDVDCPRVSFKRTANDSLPGVALDNIKFMLEKYETVCKRTAKHNYEFREVAARIPIGAGSP